MSENRERERRSFITMTNMDADTHYRIILDRDGRYDGRFFFAVRTTGIVCRPSCPAARPNKENVEYFETLEDALRHGYRACQRCRPELTALAASPQSVRLADGGSVAAMAQELGVSDRHLRRLTNAQVGASPHKLLQSRRILLAKNLLSGTTLSIVDIAFTSGFNSLRQFNEAFRNVAAATPSAYRKQHASHAATLPETMDMTVKLGYREPFEWEPLKKALLAHMIPGLEVVDEQRRTLRRLMRMKDGRLVPVTIPLGRPLAALPVTMSVSELGDVDDVVRVIKRVFDMDGKPAQVEAVLGGDPIIGPLWHEHPGLRVCGLFDPFELLINTIIGQQVSIPAARTFSARLVKAYGERVGDLYAYPSAQTLLHVDPVQMYETTRLNHKKIATIQAVCGLIDDGFELSTVVKSAAARERLLSVKGIGPWTLQYLMLRGYGDPDGFPADDLFIKRFLGVKTAKAAERIAERWRPYRGYATMQLWTKGTYE